MCSVAVCSVALCSVAVCSVAVCSVALCSVALCSVAVCSVAVCSMRAPMLLMKQFRAVLVDGIVYIVVVLRAATLDDYDPQLHKEGYTKKFPNFELLPADLKVSVECNHV